MQQLITFLTIVAYIVGPPAVVVVVLRLLAAASYRRDTFQQVLDHAAGFRRTYPIARWAIAAVVAWSWLIAGWTK